MSNKLRTIIIEDESSAVELLLSHLKKIGGIDVLKTVDSINHAEDAIHYHKPDLIFLDVELRDGTAFQWLKRIPNRQLHFGIIFITAFSKYRIQAIDVVGPQGRFFQFLTKPFTTSNLQAIIEKFNEDRAEKRQYEDQIKKKRKKLVIRTKSETRPIQFENISYIESSGSYSDIYLMNGKRTCILKSLTRLEEDLPENFFRLSDKHIINAGHIHIFKRGGTRGRKCLMNCGKREPVGLPVPKARVKALDIFIIKHV